MINKKIKLLRDEDYIIKAPIYYLTGLGQTKHEAMAQIGLFLVFSQFE
jgi:hypothetical protein